MKSNMKYEVSSSNFEIGFCFTIIGAEKCICIGMECLQYLSTDRLNMESCFHNTSKAFKIDRRRLKGSSKIA